MEIPFETGQEVFLIGITFKVYKKRIIGFEYNETSGLSLLFNDDKARCNAVYKTMDEAVQVLRDNEERRHKYALEQIENNYVSGPKLEENVTPF